jgi:predicted RNase H-like HicB family nuclease
MDRATIAFTAVYLKAPHGYVGFVEELPGVNSQGRTIDEARVNLQRLAKIVFDEERAQAEELLRGKEVVREDFVIPLRSRVRAEA